MTSRDQRLAQTKYAGKKSASAKAAEKRRTAPSVAEDPMNAMRRALAEPRSQESVDRAHRHQSGLPRLGGGN